MMLSTLSTKIDVASNVSDFRLIRARTVYLLKESLEGYRNLKAVEGMSKKSYSFFSRYSWDAHARAFEDN